MYSHKWYAVAVARRTCRPDATELRARREKCTVIASCCRIMVTMCNNVAYRVNDDCNLVLYAHVSR